MPGVIGRDRFEEVAAAAMEVPGADGVEVLLLHEWGGLTRFANNEIHQSASSEDTAIRVRVVTEGRVGVAQSNDLSPEGVAAAALSAKEMADVVAADPLWPGLAGPERIEGDTAFDVATAGASPEARASAVASLVGRVPDGFTAAGAYETKGTEVGVVNSEGQVCWAPISQASVSAVVSGGDGGSGYAETFAAAAGDLDAEAVGARAAGKAVRSVSPRPIDPGTYQVVLEPAATSTLVGFLAWVGFAGRDYVEGRSCLSGKSGQQVAAPSVTIRDDAMHPGMIGLPFDFEGMPRQEVDLIRDGVFRGVVYDRRTARQAGDGATSTGHALPSPNPDGPFPLNMCMGTGDSSVEEMVAATDRGLLITRFHYANVVNPLESSITAMTRDGTFRIEGGEVAGPVRNLRCTQSILSALSAVSAIGREAELASEFFFSASLVPALRIDAFHFSGVSDH